MQLALQLRAPALYSLGAPPLIRIPCHHTGESTEGVAASPRGERLTCTRAAALIVGPRARAARGGSGGGGGGSGGGEGGGGGGGDGGGKAGDGARLAAVRALRGRGRCPVHAWRGLEKAHAGTAPGQACMCMLMLMFMCTCDIRACPCPCPCPCPYALRENSVCAAHTPHICTSHPPRGGDVRVFQHINALKRQLDAGEVAM